MLGFALLIMAPGNYRRSAGYGQAGLPLNELFPRALRYTAALWAELGGLILLTIMLTLLVALSTPHSAARPLWLLAGAGICHFAMVASPSYPLRSMFGTEVFLVGALLASLEVLDRQQLLLSILCALLGIAMFASLPQAIIDLATLHTVTTERADYILDQRRQGHEELTVPVAVACTHFNPLWGDALSDLMQDPANERNRALALYYDVSAIHGDPTMHFEN